MLKRLARPMMPSSRIEDGGRGRFKQKGCSLPDIDEVDPEEFCLKDSCERKQGDEEK